MRKIAVPQSTKGKSAGGGFGAGLGAALFGLIAAWAGADDGMVAIFTGLGSVVGGALGAYAVRNYITDQRVIELLGDFATEMERRRKGLHSSAVVTMVSLALAGLMLSSCATLVQDDRTRALAMATLVTLNESGVDPLQVPEEHLIYARLGCSMVTSGVTVVMREDPNLGLELQSWCELFVMAAGEAQ